MIPFIGSIAGSVWAFAKTIPAKIWAGICVLAGVLILIWAVFQTGRKQAKTEAKVEELKNANAVLKDTVKTIQDDQKVVAEIRNDVDALSSDDLSRRADKWVRD